MSSYQKHNDSLNIVLSKDLSVLIGQIKAKWEAHDHSQPSKLFVCHCLDGEYRIVISETSTMYRTIDRHGQIVMVTKPEQTSDSEIVSCNTEIVPIEYRYGNETDAFVSDEIIPIVYDE